MRITTLALLFLVAAGCEKTDPLFCKENPGATGCPRGDGAVTGDPDMALPGDMNPGIDARACFGTGNFEVCLTSQPASGTLVPGGATLDTDASTLCLTDQPMGWTEAGNPAACFVVGHTVQLNALAVAGNRPLVIVATNTLSVNGDLDVASHRGGTSGAGAPYASCLPYTVVPDGSTSGGGGGAGGSFMTQGGQGGTGDNGNSSNGAPTAADAANPTILRAGCSGQNGGTGNGGAGEGVRGIGGGAVYLVAGTSITIPTGVRINASGAGGTAPSAKFGGGAGGGSGGMILLAAPTISAVGAILLANGGGGSSGAEDSGSGNPDNGDDPSSPTTPAAGGTATDNAGDGGDGYADGTNATGGDNGASSRAGGGGGGGAGWIQANVDLTGATVSPAVVVIP